MRVSEWIIGVFFLWATLLALIFPISDSVRIRILLTNALILLGYLFLAAMPRGEWTETLRDWVPQALTVLAYKQMGWFAPSSHTYQFEHGWIGWDRLLLDDMGCRALIECLGPLFPSLLELSYALVYALPSFTILVIYAAGFRKRADSFLSIYLLGMFLSYAQFPFWPSEPPRAVFPGQDMPSVHTPLRELNLWLVGNYGIHTSVFPSAHVSGAIAAAFAVAYLMPSRRRLVLTYFGYAILVGIATVYGRYHYAVDAVGGLLVGVLALPLGVWLLARAERLRNATDNRLAWIIKTRPGRTIPAAIPPARQKYTNSG